MTTSLDDGTTLNPGAVEVLHDAASWRLLGRLFECPSDAWRMDVTALARDVIDGALRAAAHVALEEGSEGLYHSIFGPGGPAPAREVSYHDSLELGSVMSSLTGCYGAFAYRPATIEPPDHVATEVGFMAYLRTKQAYALVAGDALHAAEVAEAAERFRRDHLAVVATRLASLMEEAPVTYLSMASRELAARVGPRPGPKLLPVIQPDDEDDSTFDCASA